MNEKTGSVHKVNQKISEWGLNGKDEAFHENSRNLAKRQNNYKFIVRKRNEYY